MGKSNKPAKWLKAVKKAFRSPSKERPASPDHQDTKDDADEKLLAKHDLSPAPYQAPTPHPLPSYEIITHEEVEPETSRGQPLPAPEAVAPAVPANPPESKELENVIEEEESASNDNKDAEVVEKHQDDNDDDSTLSEEEEAAARIQERFSEPLALQGLVRLQALVRGHQVRRQAATTLQTMEAIVRVQAVFRGRRVRMSKDGRAVRSRISKRRRLSSRVGAQYGDVRRLPAFQDTEPEETGEAEEANKRKRPTAYLLTQQLKRSAPNRSTLFIDCGPGEPHWGWAWLELWTNARPWEVRTLKEPKNSKSTKVSSKEYIDIIPGSRSKKNSEYTTKEVDVNTLKVKYYEDYVSNPTPAMSRSSNPTSEKKEPGAKSASPMSEKKEFGAKSASPISEKKEPGKASSHSVSETKEPATRSPRSEKKEPVSVRSSSSPSSEKKEPVSVRSSSSPFSEKKEPVSVRSSSSPGHSEKKEPISRSSPSPLSQKKEPARSATEKKELNIARSPTSPNFSEKREADHVVSDWQHASTPDSPSASLTAQRHRTISKPPPIEVPAVEPIQVEPRALEDSKSLAPPSPAIAAPPSPQASHASLPVPETPPGQDSSGDDPSVTVEHVALPDSDHITNGGETNGPFKNGETQSFSASNGEDQPGDQDTSSDKGSASASDDVMNGHTNGHQENGDSSNSRKGEKVANGENGESPTIPSKRPTCRYMAATESAKAKFRSSSNPKTRAPDTPESPARTPKRYSIGGTPLATSRGTDSPKTAFGTRKSTSFQNRGSPSPKAVALKEKPARSVETGAESPVRRNSIGSADGKRWRT